MLLYYELRGLFFSLLMTVANFARGWSRERSKSPPPIGYGVSDISDTDK